MSLNHAESSGLRMSRRCAQCSMRHKAMCSAIETDRIDVLDKIVTHTQIRPGQTVFEEGDEAKYVYNVSRGHVRLFKLLQDGRRQITGFLAPGDFLGLAARQTYAYSAEAISDADLCRFTVGELESLLEEMPPTTILGAKKSTQSKRIAAKNRFNLFKNTNNNTII